MTPLERLKARIPEIETADTSKDVTLEALLLDAKEFILDFCNRDTLPDKMIGVQVNLALVYYNRQGMEGETSNSIGGISRTVETIPADIMASLVSNRLLKVVRRK